MRSPLDVSFDGVIPSRPTRANWLMIEQGFPTFYWSAFSFMGSLPLCSVRHIIKPLLLPPFLPANVRVFFCVKYSRHAQKNT